MHFLSLFSTVLACTGVWAVPAPGPAPLPIAIPDPAHGINSNDILVDGQHMSVSPDLAMLVHYLEKMDKQMFKLARALRKYSSRRKIKSLFQLARIGVISYQAETTMKRAAKFLRRKPHPFTKDESNIIVKLLLKSVPNGQAMVDAMIARKPDFDTAVMGVGSVSHSIARSLKKMQAEVESFQTTMVSKLHSDYTGMGPMVAEEIKKTYDKLIAVYRAPGGGFDMPDVVGFVHWIGNVLKKNA